MSKCTVNTMKMNNKYRDPNVFLVFFYFVVLLVTLKYYAYVSTVDRFTNRSANSLNLFFFALQLCESRKQSKHGNDTYHAGCKSAKVCENHGQQSCPNQQSNGVSGNGDSESHGSENESGGRSSNAAKMCFKCCSTDYCNNQPPDSKQFCF